GFVAGDVARHQPGQPGRAAGRARFLHGEAAGIARLAGRRRWSRDRSHLCERPEGAPGLDRRDRKRRAAGPRGRGLMKHYPPYLDLQPARLARGTVRLPGSKSISNRILLLAALAQGSTRIFDLLASDDTHVMLFALQKLGVRWEQEGESQNFTVHGVGGAFPVHQADLFMGNAGTAIRPLTAALAVVGGDYTLHGVSRMHERPIGDLVDALNDVGAQIEYTGEPGFPPLRIRRGRVNPQRIAVRGNVSSQFLTA